MEDTMRIINIMLDPETANEVLEKGIAEIALRRPDAKFKAIMKGEVFNPDNNHKIIEVINNKGIGPDHFMNSMMAYLPGNGPVPVNGGEAKKLLYSINNEIGQLTPAVQNLAGQVDQIFDQMSAIKTLSYLNVGISLANLAVDVAGFIIVTKKLNELNVEVQQIANKLNMVANVQKNEKISDCQRLIMQCNAMAAKIKESEEIDLDKLEDLIINMKSFISEMLMDLNDQALGEELVLKMIFTLMPAYTALFSEFIRRYYFLKRSLPANYDLFISLYDDLQNEHFLEFLEDHYFFNLNMHAEDVVDALNAHTLLSLNGKVQIEDQSAILKAFETKEKVEHFETQIENYANKCFTDGINDFLINN